MRHAEKKEVRINRKVTMKKVLVIRRITEGLADGLEGNKCVDS
ncbi:hypothetical protein PMIT1303_00705 [Prochlorococcus sp. MIT 1303]|nr:hypothetical protein PMIT1303_00705 [Prochlorococcus sp. MIT 1303]